MALARTNLITAISADTFGTGNYSPGTFNATAGKLLIAKGFAIQETDAGLEGTSLVISDSGGTIVWNRIIATNNSPAWSYGVSSWWAIPTANASTLTLTLGSGGLNAHSYRLVLDQWEGARRSDPIGVKEISSTAAGGAASFNLPQSPSRTSYVDAAACIAASAGNITSTPGTDFSEVSDANSAGWAGYHVQERTNSDARLVSWADLDAAGTASGSALLAFEILADELLATQIHWPTQWDWKTQRWDFPLGVDLLLDDYLPSDTPAGAMTGATTLTFSPAGVLTGTGALVGASTLTFAPTAVLAGAGALVGATTLTFAPSATLTGAGALTGAATITFSPSGTLTNASGGAGDITGATSFTFTAVGVLTGTGDLAGSTTLTFSPSGILVDASAPVVNEPYPKPAGSSKKRRRRYEVEIDGQVFPVESVEHAQALLEQAKEIARKRAPIIAEQVVQARINAKAPIGKPIRVPVPQIKTPDRELANVVIQARHDIAKLYREQALLQEIALRLRLQELDADDDDVETLILL